MSKQLSVILRDIQFLPQINMGREVQLRVSLLLVVEDPMVEIHHLLHLESFLLTFPEGMPLPGVQREAGAAIKSTVQCILKVRYLPVAMHVVSCDVDKIICLPHATPGPHIATDSRCARDLLHNMTCCTK